MKLVTAWACVSLLCGGVALAQSQSTPAPTRAPPPAAAPQARAPQPNASVNPSTPAASTTIAAPARTGGTARARYDTREERVARQQMCSSAARQRGLTGSARSKFMHSCHLEVVAR